MNSLPLLGLVLLTFTTYVASLTTYFYCDEVSKPHGTCGDQPKGGWVADGTYDNHSMPFSMTIADFLTRLVLLRPQPHLPLLCGAAGNVIKTTSTTR